MNPVQAAIYALIKKFIQRQRIVLEAMRALRPDLVMRTENEGTPEEWARLRLEYKSKPAIGEWGSWEYFLHGDGCRLTHKITGEPIEWDTGDIMRFDRFWFANHLEWQLHLSVEDKNISYIRVWLQNVLGINKEPSPSFGPIKDAVFPVLEELHQIGILTRHEQYYTLIEDD
ncbi:MAG: hypothetical protein K8L99_15820 [Anaerolineae bacterium]|nr:hypothetical protein [Anaerolineae bacterium]